MQGDRIGVSCSNVFLWLIGFSLVFYETTASNKRNHLENPEHDLAPPKVRGEQH